MLSVIFFQVKKYRILFLRFTHEDPKAQKYLLGGIEQVIALHKDVLLPKVPGIFKLFYDADILEEKVLLEWATKVSKKYVSRELSQEIHTKAEPFIKWLKEAEEEEDSDSDEEDDDDDLEVWEHICIIAVSRSLSNIFCLTGKSVWYFN